MEATRVRLRISPGAQRSEIVGRHGDAWKIRVTSPPADGRANDAVVKLLAETLDVSRDAVRLVSGHAARDKIVALAGVDAGEVDRRLAAAAER
jgi:uncharacterized protein